MKNILVLILSALLVFVLLSSGLAISGALIMLGWNYLIAAPLGLTQIPFVVGVGISIFISFILILLRA